jgi:DNA/RNA-binding domain of Phe-tRNA-synthetase-like protein
MTAALDFSIAPEVAAHFPGIAVHAVCCEGFRSAADRIEDTTLLGQAVAGVRALEIDREKLAAHPAIAVWREGYAALRARPSQFRASIESLVRRALGGSDLALPIPAVNLYNALSLKHLAPMGAYDLAKLPAAPMILRLAAPDTDRFDPLGGKASDFPLNPDLVVYASGDAVLCWGFNCRDSRETGLDPTSDRIVFFSESLDAEGAARSRAALFELRSILEAAGMACGALLVADAAKPDF